MQPHPRDEELERLQTRLAEAEQALHALASAPVDALGNDTPVTPLLLHSAREQLHQRDRLFRALFEASLDALLLADDSGTYVDANPAACELFRLSRADLLRCKLADFALPGYDHEGSWRRFLEVGRLRGRLPLLRPDGTWRQLDFSATAHVLPGLHLSALRDVTEQDWAEQALKASEARFRAVVEKSFVAAIPAGKGCALQVYTSAPVARLLGLGPDALNGLDHLQCEDRERAVRAAEECLEHHGTRRVVEFRATHHDGEPRWLEATLSNLLADPAVEALVASFRDITARKVAEHALHESRHQLEQAQAVAHVGSWTGGIHPDEAILYSNECYRIFGRPLGSRVTIQDFFAQVHPADLAGVKQKIRQAHEHELAYEMEYRIIRPDGELRWVHASSELEPHAPGVPARMIGVVRDVTDRKVALEELRASELRYRRIIETTSEGVWTLDKNLNTTFMNGRMSAMLGYAPDETPGRSVFDFVHEHDWPQAAETFARRKRGIKERKDFRCRRKDGSELWVSIESTPLLDEDGNFEGILGMFTDISERRQAEETRNRLAALVESSADPIVGLDARGVIHSWNRAAHALFGHSAQEAVGQPIHLLVPAERRAESGERLRRLMAGETVGPLETEALRKDGTLVPILLTVSPVRDADGRVVGASAVSHDLSHQNRAEAALRRSEEELRQAQKMEAIGSLAGGVAHDFNNLLFIIIGYTSLLLDAMPEGAVHRAEIEEVRRAADRAAALTRQLLAFGRRQVLQPTILDLNLVLLNFERMFRRVLGADIELVLHSHPALGRVEADPSQIDQVLMNLVVNACDAMPRGGTLTLETANRRLSEAEAAEYAGLKPGPYVVVKVSDTGMGIDETVRRRIFEPFFTTKEKGKGTGLGLSTVFGIVQQSGGHITVDSTPGRGSTFSVYLPQSERALDRLSTPMEAGPLLGSETVLLVEDDDQVRELTRSVLRRSGYEVLEAQNAGEALLLSEQHEGPIHLLLSDVIMPRVGGHVLAERLARARPELKVLFMSGYVDDPVKLEHVIAAGAAFLPKPVLPTVLQKKVRDVLDA
jgi:PAS domain S-box-containing protein